VRVGITNPVILMRHNPIHFTRCLIPCLAGYAICVPLAPFTLLGEDTKSQAAAMPKIDHILLEVSNLNASIAFYRDFLGLRLKSQSDWLVMLESNNVGVFLRNSRWG
jgi:Glyoxalase/Bleomycin resistance protein/Dioxygenase superfamily